MIGDGCKSFNIRIGIKHALYGYEDMYTTDGQTHQRKAQTQLCT